MKRIVSLMLAFMLAFVALPVSQPVVAEDADANTFILPAGLTRIDEQAFAGNAALKTVIVPNTITAIDSRAFEDCAGLTEVVIAGRDVSIAADAFEGCSGDMVFYVHPGSDPEFWAMTRGYVCEPLGEDTDAMAHFEALIAHSGMNAGMLMSGLYASKCLIVRTCPGVNRLPDISAFNPIDIYRSEENLYYIQFSDEGDAQDCLEMLITVKDTIVSVEPDRVSENDNISAQGVTIAEYWGTNDTMGFDEYAPYVAQYASGSVTVAVIDSGVTKSVWDGNISSAAASFVGGDAFTDSVRHGSKVASIINDSIGEAVNRATLLPVKVVNSSSLYRTSMIIEGIRHAVNNGADIINMSFGWDDKKEGRSPEIEHQIKQANASGIHVVVAAGNGDGDVMFPANCDGALAVSALTYSKQYGYSVASRAGAAVDYTAPGLYLSTTDYPNIDTAGDVLGAASTSFAAPQIAAALALIELDSTKSGSAVSVLNSCCEVPEGLSAGECGKGLPHLEELAVIKTNDIVLKNMGGGSVPTRLWLGNTGSNFLLGWEIIPANASSKIVTVTSSDPSVVTVQQFGNSNALISAKALGEAKITVTNGEVTKEATIVVEQPVTEILVTGTDGKLVIGDEVQLAAAALPENASDKEVAWTSSNDAVVSVTAGGLLKAKAVGQTTITCASKDGYGTTAKIDITVVEVPDAESISLSAKERDISSGTVTMQVDEILTLEAKILPESALQKVSYSIFPQGIVEISANGVLKALKPGSATVMVTASSGQNVYTGLTVNVAIYPVSLSVSAARSTLDVGENTYMTGVVEPENATVKAVTWKSSNEAVATVNSSTGYVTAIAPGTAQITGTTVNGKRASATITVRQPITITFNANGGACSEKTRTAYSGYEVGELPVAEREYWQFDGWYTQASGGAKVTAESAFAESTTLYAQWTGLPYTITFDANGGACATKEMTARVGTKLGSLPVASRNHYSFAGWYTMPEGGDLVTVSYVQSTDASFTLYAHWTKKPYTMTFNANGGICDIETLTGEVDTPIGELPVPEREYYIFDGWYTALTGGTKITESYVNITANPVTAYAHWTPMGYVMTFDPNGGKCSVETKDCLVDTDVGTLPVPVREYYTFNGWYTNAKNPVHVTETYRQATPENVTVQADWSGNPYKITFDANGGLCDTSSKTAYVGTVIGELPVATREYYIFEGWYTEKTGGTKVFRGQAQWTDMDLTLYAHWTGVPFTIYYHLGEGEGNTIETVGTVGVALGEQDVQPVATKDYHTFNGWFTAETGGTQIKMDYVPETDAVMHLYAQWTPNSYTVTFDANGGACDKSEMTGKVGIELGQLPEAVREYYVFDGWYTEQSGGTKVDASYTQSTDANLALYAHWTPMEYTMMFNVNGSGASTSASAKTYHVGTAVGSLPTATREYYRFDGWFTQAEGGTQITTSYVHDSTSTITVYAHWTRIAYDIALNANGGSCSTATVLAKAGEGIGTLPTPTRTYYSFDGWYTAASGGTKVTSSTTFTGSATLYAHWTLKGYGSWSAWQDGAVYASDTRQVETATFYGYCYFECSRCGNHMHVSTQDYTWGGGCGYSAGGIWHEIWTTRYYNYSNPGANLADWHSTGRYYYDDPGYGRLFAWKDPGNPYPYGRTMYRYRDLIP